MLNLCLNNQRSLNRIWNVYRIDASKLKRSLGNNSDCQADKGLYCLNEDEIRSARLDNLQIWSTVDAIKRSSFRYVNLDCLGIEKPLCISSNKWIQSLCGKLETNEYDTRVQIQGFVACYGNKFVEKKVSEILDIVRKIYIESGIGLEYSHINNEEEVDFLTTQFELQFTDDTLFGNDKEDLAKLLIECEAFDQFLATKFPTTKRYGLEGAESMVICLRELLKLTCSSSKSKPNKVISDVVIGIPHRGRLNLLCCLLGFSPTAIFSKIQGNSEFNLMNQNHYTGDVLSHLSINTRYDISDVNTNDGTSAVNVTLLPNPSHLELASPMAVGVARGRAHNIYHNYLSSPKLATSRDTILGKINGDDLIGNYDEYEEFSSNVLPIQLHGDAAFSGQGVIQETLQLSKPDKFSVKGSIHIVVNNQIGFTTDKLRGRSSRHCTDVLKMIEAPILHVNGENIDAVIKATNLAFKYRQKFNKDIGINLVCFRRHGHNEMDDPSVTQPQMYDIVRDKISVVDKYTSELGMDQATKQKISSNYKAFLQTKYKQIDSYKPDNDNYRNFNLISDKYRDHLFKWQTGFPLNSLQQIALSSVRVPENFSLHPTVKRSLVDERIAKFTNPENLSCCQVDWALAEILAFGSLLSQDHSVRLSGQDVGRGTFSTRHAVLVDRKTGHEYVPLNNMTEDSDTEKSSTHHSRKAKLEVNNSILSEEAVLAYEYGYSIETCELTIWEAQFGDFFNTAQSVIDTLVCSGEKKWLKQSALTLLLPHGLDGMGPEHSSARIERFLQDSNSSYDSVDTEATTNWSVCFPTLPSQYFHLLRRQVLRPFRKPLIIMAPKMIFRHPECKSTFEDMGLNSYFKPVLDDPRVSSQVDTLVFCSGKLYFTLDEHRKTNQMKNIALIRIEELCPFPAKDIADILKKYSSVGTNNIHWLQEEHKNQGAFNFVDARFRNLLGVKLSYIGRAESESPATGNSVLYKKEVQNLINSFVKLDKH